jgi:hypothetical protein
MQEMNPQMHEFRGRREKVLDNVALGIVEGKEEPTMLQKNPRSGGKEKERDYLLSGFRTRPKTVPESQGL